MFLQKFYDLQCNIKFNFDVAKINIFWHNDIVILYWQVWNYIINSVLRGQWICSRTEQQSQPWTYKITRLVLTFLNQSCLYSINTDNKKKIPPSEFLYHYIPKQVFSESVLRWAPKILHDTQIMMLNKINAVIFCPTFLVQDKVWLTFVEITLSEDL